MGCACGKRRAVTAGGETLGYQVIYPDGTETSVDEPFFSLVEAKAEIRKAGGGTIKRLTKKPGSDSSAP